MLLLVKKEFSFPLSVFFHRGSSDHLSFLRIVAQSFINVTVGVI